MISSPHKFIVSYCSCYYMGNKCLISGAEEETDKTWWVWKYLGLNLIFQIFTFIIIISLNSFIFFWLFFIFIHFKSIYLVFILMIYWFIFLTRIKVILLSIYCCLGNTTIRKCNNCFKWNRGHILYIWRKIVWIIISSFILALICNFATFLSIIFILHLSIIINIFIFNNSLFLIYSLIYVYFFLYFFSFIKCFSLSLFIIFIFS